MKQQHADYRVVPYPKMRRLEAIAYRSVQHKTMMHGLLEVDVTRARAFLREYKAKTGGGVPVVHGVPHRLPGKSRR